METVEGETSDTTAKVQRFGVRHCQVLLQFFFYVVLFGVQLALSVVIPNILDSGKLGGQIDLNQLSLALEGYFLGFIITVLFGGWLCKQFGFKWPMITMMIVISAFTLFLPFFSKELGFPGLLFCRIVQGLCSGLIFPMPADFINKWIPVSERTTLGTVVYASSIFGNLLAIFIGPLLKPHGLSWAFIFQGYGYLAIVWAILMAIFGADSPELYHRKISEHEVKYILQNRGNARSKLKVKIPWIKILTSLPVWAIVIAQAGATWMLYVLTLNVPMLMMYDFAVYKTQNIIEIILLITWVLSFALSGIAELLINNGKTTITQSRKIFNSVGSLLPALILLFLILLMYGNSYLGVAIWCVMSVASVGTILGAKLNANDISSNFSCIIYGFATFVGMIFNIINILILRNFMYNDWHILFIYTAVLLFLTNGFFLKYGSGEEQEWDCYEDIEDDEIGLSKSAAYVECNEGKYLLFLRKQ